MKKNLDVFLELVEAGISIREVAKEFKVPQSTLGRWLKEEAVDRTYIKTKLIIKAKKINQLSEKRDNKECEICLKKFRTNWDLERHKTAKNPQGHKKII